MRVAKKQEEGMTVSDRIWSDIKDKKLELFALPNQVVHNHCKPVSIEPSKLYLTISVGAVLPALEAAFGNKYDFERTDKFIIVSDKKV